MCSKPSDTQSEMRPYEDVDLTAEEIEEIYATVDRERPQIQQAIGSMIDAMRALSDVSQKEALVQLTALWIHAKIEGGEAEHSRFTASFKALLDDYLQAARTGSDGGH